MTVQDIPPVDIKIVHQIIETMSPQDYKIFCEWHMIQFPEWLSKLINEEANIGTESFDEFVKIACIHELIERIMKRGRPKDEQANGNIQSAR